MIQAIELRIGNWIFNESAGENQKVSGDLLYAIDGLKNGAENEYYPIPLTPELLEKIASKHASVVEMDARTITLTIDGHKIVFILDSNGGISPASKYQYLHQLQNLIFALTGKEITVNF